MKSPVTAVSEHDEGNVLVELIFMIAALLVPLALGAVAVVSIASGAELAETVARESARAFVFGDHDLDAFVRAEQAARLAFRDAGFAYVEPAITCAASPCLTPGATVDVLVRIPVTVPWGIWTARARHRQVVDPWRTW